MPRPARGWLVWGLIFTTWNAPYEFQPVEEPFSCVSVAIPLEWQPPWREDFSLSEPVIVSRALPAAPRSWAYEYLRCLETVDRLSIPFSTPEVLPESTISPNAPSALSLRRRIRKVR